MTSRIPSSRTLIPLLAGVLSLVAAGGCAERATRPVTLADYAGVYDLVAVDGQPLPYDVSYVSDYTRRVEMLEGKLEIRDDRTFSDRSVTRFWRRDGSDWTDRVSEGEGTAALEEGEIEFQDAGGMIYRMQPQGGALVQRWFIYELRYVRR